MKLKSCFLVFGIGLFQFLSAVYSAQAQKEPTTSVQQNTTTETRTFTGDIPSPSARPSARRTNIPGETLCQTETPDYGDEDNPRKPTNQAEINAKSGAQRIGLHYVRDAQNISSILQRIRKKLGMTYLDVSTRSNVNNEIVLFGPSRERECAHRIIAALDLPLPGINLQMWGIQISTRKSKGRKALAEVMPEVRDQINLTQQLVRDNFAVIQTYTREQIDSGLLIDDDFKEIVEDIKYDIVFNGGRPLSILDVVMIGSSTKEPVEFYNGLFQRMMENMDGRYKIYLEAMREKERPPFESFFRSRGLTAECVVKTPIETDSVETDSVEADSVEADSVDKNELVSCKNEAKKIDNGRWQWKEISKESSLQVAKAGRRLMLEFAVQYGDFISNPNLFSPYELQQTADKFNGRLQDTTDVIQKDIEEFFMLPTLSKIQEIVSREKSITYAQVGRTTAATLSGVRTEIGASSVSAFDVTPPLTLSQLLESARTLNEQISPFIPTVSPETTPTGEESNTEDTTPLPQITVGGVLPVSQVIALMAAFAEQEPIFRELKTGITLNFTPNVLRDLNSAELEIDLTIVDPTATGTQEGTQDGKPSKKARPLSRIGQQTVKTKVYTQSVDFFALSTFSNQSTLDGGRAYVPIVGHIWKGIFSAIPVFGDLFSWQRSPQNVQHESLLLTNSFISPTSMGLALLYPINSSDYDDVRFCDRHYEVQVYLEDPNANENFNECITKRVLYTQ
ncbi:MAG: hypothetical protein AB4372_17805 [Xenococcus sp. (in: cyanobacteria)]